MATLDHQISYVAGASLPDVNVWWMDPDAAGLVDFSSGWIFQVVVDAIDGVDSFTKSAGITGAAGSGTGQETGDVPNLTIDWLVSGEISSLNPGHYRLQIEATRVADSKVRIRQLTLRITESV